ISRPSPYTTLFRYDDPLDQRLAAARDGDVDPLGQSEEAADGGAIGRFDELHGAGRQTALFQRRLQQMVQRLIAVERFLAAAKDDRVPAFDAESGRIGGDVGAGLVDEEHDS